MKYLAICFLLMSCNVVQMLTDGETDPSDDFYKNNYCDDSTSTNSCNQDSTQYSLSNDLVSFWRFDEIGSSEGRTDVTGNNNLDVNGAIWYEDGIHGNGLQSSGFDTSNYTFNGASTGFSFGNNIDFTIAFWMKRSSQSASPKYIFDKIGTEYIRISVPGTSDQITLEINGNILNLTG